MLLRNVGLLQNKRRYNPEDSAPEMFAVGYTQAAGWIDGCGGLGGLDGFLDGETCCFVFL
jgi:hypothetical protein